ncbi:MAG: GNAT family N-acetyltransferase [Candidatus Dormibacteria bacterium]
MTEVLVRLGHGGDAAAIVSTIREGFATHILERVVYGCFGAEDFVAGTIEGAPLAAPRFLVADSGADGLIAVAEVTSAGSDLFLSYIATKPAARGRGVGARLLAAAIADGLDRGAETLTLDVFEANERALAWYRALGMTTIGERGWWDGGRPSPGITDAAIFGLPQARLCQQAFGFAEFTVATRDGSFRIGQLGSRFFRVTDPAALGARGLLGALAALDSSRELMVMGPIDGELSPAGTLVLRSLRLRGALAELKGHLSGANR